MSISGPIDAAACLAGGGVSGQIARAVEWQKTPLGAPDGWPQSLRTIVSTILHSRHPMFLWWGPELVQFYNDAYLPSLGRGRHPAAMGQRGRDCWQEIWPIIWPQIDDVMSRGISSWNEDHLIPILRNGRTEEVYWTYGYSPVYEEAGRVGGTLVVCTETTERVLAERRSRTLRRLGETTAWDTDADQMIQHVAETLKEVPADIPFGLFYDCDAAAAQLRLVASFGFSDAAFLEAAQRAIRPHVSCLRGDARMARHGDVIPLEVAGLQVGPWPEPCPGMVLFPIMKVDAGRTQSLVVFGLSPRLDLDGNYRYYLELLAEHVGLARARIDAFRVRAAIESERNNLLLQAPVATALITGPEHVFKLANQLFCQMVGRGDIVGRSAAEVFPELVGTPVLRMLDRVYQTGEPFASSEYQVPLKRGSDGTLEDAFFKFNVEPIRDPCGAVFGMMAIAVEITELVRGRQALEKTNAERQRLLERLEAASRAKDEFLAMLGHELRNPLSPIVTALRLMSMKGDASTTKERAVIERQVDHLTRLVDDLLDVSKIARGKIALRKETVEISAVIDEAVEMASMLFEQRAHKLSVDVPRTGLVWSGDPVRLAQVVSNLLTNAARYTQPGGDIRLDARRDGATLVISVKDNGVGIAAETLPRIFDLFVQERRSADRVEGGLGIGLTLVKSLVRLHGGDVVARSEGPGKGSEFIVTLPAPEEGSLEVIRAPGAPGPLRPAAHGKRILVVDDNGDAADVLAAALRSAGHDVAVATDPVVAILVAEKFRPEIAVLDIGLPVMDGYELGSRLCEQLGAPGCRLIAVSGCGDDHERERDLPGGFHSHLAKPVDLDALLLAVDAAANSG